MRLAGITRLPGERVYLKLVPKLMMLNIERAVAASLDLSSASWSQLAMAATRRREKTSACAGLRLPQERLISAATNQRGPI
jgi:hypothetical protein